MKTLGIIGGTGMDQWGDPEAVHTLDTPYGLPSSALQEFHSGGARIIFLARHGEAHNIPPHAVNYRANCWAMKRIGVDHLLGVNAVGAIRAGINESDLVVPDQIVDYTWGREHTISDSGDVPLIHADFEFPYDSRLRKMLVAAAASSGVQIHDGGTHGVAQGPRFESAAEVKRMQRDGCDVVGMTAMPEVAIARELGLDFAGLCVISNIASGLSDEPVNHQDILVVLKTAMDNARTLIRALLESL
jgi:5'-methylthioinosine phosphorylase